MIPSITGTAFVTAEATLIVDAETRSRMGFGRDPRKHFQRVQRLAAGEVADLVAARGAGRDDGRGRVGRSRRGSSARFAICTLRS